MKNFWVRLLLVLVGILVLRYGFFIHPLSSLRWVESCPDQALTASEVEAIYQEGWAIAEEGRRGEHYMSTEVMFALPSLREAARQGHRGAMDQLTSHLMQAGILEVTSGPEFWRTQLGVAEEAMMWFILKAHLDGEIPAGEEEVYRVLLDPSLPFPEGFFRSGEGTAWMFQMLTEGALDHARSQAFAWRNCSFEAPKSP
jgi:hypothetical protein